MYLGKNSAEACQKWITRILVRVNPKNRQAQRCGLGLHTQTPFRLND